MTNEEKRICIGEACGWKFIDGFFRKGLAVSRMPGSGEVSIPDYLNDLNAMASAEDFMILRVAKDREEGERFKKQMDHYEDLLVEVTFFAWHATAKQRADAFLSAFEVICPPAS